MKVYFTTYNKMRNATSIPDNFSASYDCVLLDDCSVQNPRLKLNFGQAGNPVAYNYAMIPDFTGRYYFITDWTWSGRLWIATLSVDVLGSFRTNILNSTQYVIRSASAYNLKAIESQYPTLAGYTATTNRADNSWSNVFDDGTYVVGMISSSGDGGAVSYYEMSPGTFKALCQYLFNRDLYDLEDILQDISEALWKTLFNPFQYIVSVQWFPFVDTGGIPVSKIQFGWFQFNISARYISDATRSIDIKTLEVPKNPTYSKTGALKFEYFNTKPFASYTLHYNPWGDIPIDGELLVGVDEITLRPQIDLTTGKGVLQIFNGTTLLGQYTSQVGVPIAIAQDNNNVISGATSGMMGGVAAGMSLAGFAGGVVSGLIGSAAGALGSANIEKLGAQGSVAGLGDGIFLTAEFWQPAEQDREHFGYPYLKRAKLSTLSGYTVCENVNVIGSGASVDEVASIKSMMEGGFYIG